MVINQQWKFNYFYIPQTDYVQTCFTNYKHCHLKRVLKTIELMILITFIYNFRFRIDVLLQGVCVFYVVLVFVYPTVQSIAHFVEQKQHYAFRIVLRWHPKYPSTSKNDIRTCAAHPFFLHFLDIGFHSFPFRVANTSASRKQCTQRTVCFLKSSLCILYFRSYNQ